jgi:hypothetical protein
MEMQMRPNGSAAGLSARHLYGDGSTPGSNTDILFNAGLVNANTSTNPFFSNNKIYIPNYNLAINKAWSVDSAIENDQKQALVSISANLWSNVAAINSLSFYLRGGIFVQYSTAYLYGIK